MGKQECFDSRLHSARLHVLVPDRFSRAYITRDQDGQWHFPNVMREHSETPAQAAVRAAQTHLGLELSTVRFAWIGQVASDRQPAVDELVIVRPVLAEPEAIQIGLDYNRFQDLGLLGAAMLERTIKEDTLLLPLVNIALDKVLAGEG